MLSTMQQAPQQHDALLQRQLAAAKQLEALFADTKSVASQTVALYATLLDGR